MVKEAMIWGAGKWGNVAYHYYNNVYKLTGYIDGSEKLQGQSLNGLKIFPPEILRNRKRKVVIIIASKKYEHEIKKQLAEDYAVWEGVIFRIADDKEDLKGESCRENELAVAFSGGLGNQMFEYALYRLLKKMGKNVKADRTAYIGADNRSFILETVFPEIRMTYCHAPRQAAGETIQDESSIYCESKEQEFIYNEDLLQMNAGYIKGYHQSHKYPDTIRNELLADFTFEIKEEERISNILNSASQKGELVSVHLRRGDYLTGDVRKKYGNICTENYYQKAMDTIRTRIKNPVFCFLSNDIEWVKERYGSCDKAVFIEKEMFEDYRDWYDMYIMSRCRHNIIANSTFSWWGAWLNQNPEKIVIAPKKWLKDNDGGSICPAAWIRV